MKTKAAQISKKYLELNSSNFVGVHWEIAQALLNNQINPSTANAFATQTARVLGFKKLELLRARLIGEKPVGKLLGGRDK